MRDKDRERRETVTPAYFSSPGCSHHPAPVQRLAPGKHTHTHTFIVSQLNSQCLAPGKHTGFQCFTITFNVSWQTHTEAFIVSVFNIQCLTAGKHIDRLSLFQCLTHNVLLLQTPRLGLSQYTDTGLCHNTLTPGCVTTHWHQAVTTHWHHTSKYTKAWVVSQHWPRLR